MWRGGREEEEEKEKESDQENKPVLPVSVSGAPAALQPAKVTTGKSLVLHSFIHLLYLHFRVQEHAGTEGE